MSGSAGEAWLRAARKARCLSEPGAKAFQTSRLRSDRYSSFIAREKLSETGFQK